MTSSGSSNRSFRVQMGSGNTGSRFPDNSWLLRWKPFTDDLNGGGSVTGLAQTQQHQEAGEHPDILRRADQPDGGTPEEHAEDITALGTQPIDDRPRHAVAEGVSEEET